jgi:hypothetical protein
MRHTEADRDYLLDGAGRYRSFPAWLASMTQEPAWSKVTVAPEIEYTEAMDGSMVIAPAENPAKLR